MGSTKQKKKSIPLGRRLVYAAVTLAALLALTEGVSQLLARDLPPSPPGYTDARTFLVDYANRIREPWFLKQDGPLPGVKGPKVVLRVADDTAGARPFPGPGGKVQVLAPRELPAGRQVLVLGASAAYGDGVKYDATLARQLELLLQKQGGPDAARIRVLGLARPAWELKSVAALAERLLAELPAPPAAVVLYTGNNEFSIPPIFSVQHPSPLAALATYRLAVHHARKRGWLRPPPGSNFHAFRNPRWEPMDAAGVTAQLWRGSPGLEDMRYWAEVRKTTLSAFERRLHELTAVLAKKNVPLVLVPPPVNLHFFPGDIYPQPVTYRPVGGAAYEAMAGRLANALAGNDNSAVEAVIREAPDGPLQRYWLGQALDKKGRHKEAAVQLRAARDHTMGLLAALPAVVTVVKKLAGSGVVVIDSADFYPADRSVAQRARELFNDSCHPSALGHRLLAVKVAAALGRLWAAR